MNNKVIFTYTAEQAIEDGFLIKLTDNILITPGVFEMKGKGFASADEDYMFGRKLLEAVKAEYDKMPEVSTNGENDKSFFTVTWRGTKMFVAQNELGGLTIMLPEEY